MKKAVLLAAASAGLCVSGFADAESVLVKYRGEVELAPFECKWTKSSFVNRICYDKTELYVLVDLRGTYYHYCKVPHSVVVAWLNADSLGSYYNSVVKGRFDCRSHRTPAY